MLLRAATVSLAVSAATAADYCKYTSLSDCDANENPVCEDFDAVSWPTSEPTCIYPNHGVIYKDNNSACLKEVNCQGTDTLVPYAKRVTIAGNPYIVTNTGVTDGCTPFTHTTETADVYKVDSNLIPNSNIDSNPSISTPVSPIDPLFQTFTDNSIDYYHFEFPESKIAFPSIPTAVTVLTPRTIYRSDDNTALALTNSNSPLPTSPNTCFTLIEFDTQQYELKIGYKLAVVVPGYQYRLMNHVSDTIDTALCDLLRLSGDPTTTLVPENVVVFDDDSELQIPVYWNLVDLWMVWDVGSLTYQPQSLTPVDGDDNIECLGNLALYENYGKNYRIALLGAGGCPFDLVNFEYKYKAEKYTLADDLSIYLAAEDLTADWCLTTPDYHVNYVMATDEFLSCSTGTCTGGSTDVDVSADVDLSADACDVVGPPYPDYFLDDDDRLVTVVTGPVCDPDDISCATHDDLSLNSECVEFDEGFVRFIVDYSVFLPPEEEPSIPGSSRFSLALLLGLTIGLPLIFTAFSLGLAAATGVTLVGEDPNIR